MNYIPHTEAERAAMLETIGVDSVEALFDAIPEPLRFPRMSLPPAMTEMEIMRELGALSDANGDGARFLSFLGAGAYNHYVPSLIDHIIRRGDFFTAYTPYQPEVSQGTLQAIFEFQSMMRDLTGMDVCTASHYDGATSFAEAVIMACGITRRKKALVWRQVHPQYRAVLRTYSQFLSHVEVVGDDAAASLDELAAKIDSETACVCVSNPSFLGNLNDLSKLAERAHAHGALLVVAINPLAMGAFAPPATHGADIVVGEAQVLGVPVGFGGPYLGFFSTRREHMRRIPGRIVGETLDREGRRGYVLTLKTREQDIRREKATSNICTNQGLMALCAAVYLTVMGANGVRKVSELNYQKAHYAAERLGQIPGFKVITSEPFFNEFVLRCPMPVAVLNERLRDDHEIIGGYDLGQDFPELGNAMLVCATEIHTREDIDRFAEAVAECYGKNT